MPELIRYLYLVIFSASILSILQKYHWSFDLLSHFHFPYFFAGCIGLILGISHESWRLTSVASSILLVSGHAIWKVYQRKRPLAKGPSFKLLQCNILHHNPHWDDFFDLVADEDPDVITVQENSEAFTEELVKRLTNYPHKVTRTRETDHDNFGIALFSKMPIEEASIIESTEKKIPSIITVIRVKGQRMQLIVTRPTPPFTSHWFSFQRSQFDDVALQVKHRLPHIIVGDLNSTPFAIHFRRFRKRTRTIPSYSGMEPRLTWPAQLRLFGLLPIDHILHSRNISVSDVHRGPYIGSDHFPLIAIVTLPK